MRRLGQTPEVWVQTPEPHSPLYHQEQTICTARCVYPPKRETKSSNQNGKQPRFLNLFGIINPQSVSKTQKEENSSRRFPEYASSAIFWQCSAPKQKWSPFLEIGNCDANCTTSFFFFPRRAGAWREVTEPQQMNKWTHNETQQLVSMSWELQEARGVLTSLPIPAWLELGLHRQCQSRPFVEGTGRTLMCGGH